MKPKALKPSYRGEGANRMKFIPEHVEHAPLVEWLETMKSLVLQYRKLARPKERLRRLARIPNVHLGDVELMVRSARDLSVREEHLSNTAGDLERILTKHTRGRWVRAPERKKAKRKRIR